MKVLFCVSKVYYVNYQDMIRRMEALGLEVKHLMLEEAADVNILKREIKDADIFTMAVARGDKEIIDAAPKLKYIIKTGTGVDNIDVEYARKKGIVVTNARGGNANAVAELVIGLMFSLSRKIPLNNKRTKQGYWEKSTLYECSGKTMGIIGFGTIGQLVAKFAGVFNMNLLAYGQYKNTEKANELGVTFVELDELLKRSDYVVISTSMKPSTYHLINAERIALMKPTVQIINVARGKIIDEQALFTALSKKRIAGAALDVFEEEPPNKNHLGLDNLISTSHIGGMTVESAERVADITLDNLERFLNGRPLRFRLN
ncbi:glycerate dehydrogenase [Sporolactobacillus sp. THM7-4]|nr:glycerate dehydrogenase [Sporolactobacillus sp. THM7-4]